MKQIVQNYRSGELRIEEVPVPLCKADGVLVHNMYSLISVGTEKLMIDMAKKSIVGKAMARPDLVRLVYQTAKREGIINTFKEAMNRLDEPVPLGYSSAGVVIEVGKGAEEFKVGDRVACAGAGFASHAEVVWIPRNLCVKIPKRTVNSYSLSVNRQEANCQVTEEATRITNNSITNNFISFEEAAFVMLGAIALHGVRLAGLTFGENVAVIGLGLIGLITVQILKAVGCTVIGSDIDEKKCQLAKELGADEVAQSSQLKAQSENFASGYGVDAVIITAASRDNKPLLLAEDICRKKGRIVLVGMADIRLARQTLWEKEISLIVSKAAGPGSIEERYEKKGYDYPISYIRWTEKRNMEYFLQLVAQRKVRVDRFITHRFKIEDTLKAYEMILNNKEPYIGVILNYSGQMSDVSVSDQKSEIRCQIPDIGYKKVSLKQTSNISRLTTNTKNIGLIGGGNFTKNILLPALKKLKNVNFVGIATTSGVSSNHVGRKFRFSYCTSDYKEILKDESIGSVIITTPHNLHGEMVVEALKAHKNVFVEKPLCLTEHQLKDIIETYNQQLMTNNRFLMVGFSRRFAPLTQEIKRALLGRNTPLIMNYRINAGYVSEDHWTQDPEVGGGRIIGEVCHFIDLFQFLTNSTPKTVFSQSISGNLGKYLATDNLCLVVNFDDGSVGTILYTAKGTKTLSRERLEIFAEDSVFVIEDFRKAIIIKEGKTKKIRKWNQDLGYLNELRFFLDSEKPNQDNKKLFTSYVHTTLTTFKALESLQKGILVRI